MQSSHILIRRLRWSRGNALISGCLSASPSLACCYLQGPNVWRYLHTPDDKQPQLSPRPVLLLTGSCSLDRTHRLFTKGRTQHLFQPSLSKGTKRKVHGKAVRFTIPKSFCGKLDSLTVSFALNVFKKSLPCWYVKYFLNHWLFWGGQENNFFSRMWSADPCLLRGCYKGKFPLIQIRLHKTPKDKQVLIKKLMKGLFFSFSFQGSHKTRKYRHPNHSPKLSLACMGVCKTKETVCAHMGSLADSPAVLVNKLRNWKEELIIC